MAQGDSEPDSTDSLTVYLAKAGVDAANVLKSMAGLNRFEIKDAQGALGTLYVQLRKPQVPRWARLFKGQVDPNALGRTGSTAMKWQSMNSPRS